MIETKRIVIDEVLFEIHQFTARECQKIELMTIKILSPLLNALGDIVKAKKVKLDEIDISAFVQPIQEILCGLDEVTYDRYINRIIAETYADFKQDGSMKPTSLKNEDIFNAVFIGRTILLYKLLIEIMKFNKFAFFGLMGGGGILQMDTSNEQKKDNKKKAKN